MSVRRSRVIVAVGLAIAIAAPAAAATWTSIPIDTSGQASGPSLAISNDGQVHVAYWLSIPDSGVFSSGLMLASGDASGFTSSSLSSADLAYPSIAYDSANHLHVAAYLQGGHGGVDYLTDASGVLSSETVTTEIQATAPALAIGPTGEIRIAYATALDPGVYVATRTASGWSSTRVADAVTDTMSHTIDSQGASHVVWGVFDGSDLTGGIGYATGSGATWSTRMLTTMPGDIDPDVAIGSDGSIHVVFSRRGGTRPQLSEVIVTPRHLRVSRLVRADTSTPDVAFDATGAEHIAYNNMSRSSLHYRTNASGHWVETEIDYGGGGVGLSLTAAGEPWITHNRFDGLVAAHD